MAGIGEARWIKSEKGKDKLVDPHGFIYNFQKTTSDGNTKIWQCEEYRKIHKCPVRARTLRNNIININKSPNHVADATNVTKAEVY